MKRAHNKINRRNFLKTMGAAGAAPAFAGVTNVFGSATGGSATGKAGPNEPNKPANAEQDEFPQVPKRRLGRTGVEVSVLSLGTNRLDSQIILRNAFRWGVTYWDTAYNYTGGNSEITIGKFIAKNPQARKKLFIVSKASEAERVPGAKTFVEGVEQRLAESLKRMNTSYIDLYCGIHMLSDPAQLTDELKQWAENAKQRKLIRFFGFSTHENIPWCLLAAAESGWVDVVMPMYNFRLMQDSRMAEAVETCHKAGVGLVAMKVQAMGRRKQIDRKVETKVIDHFQKQGFTLEQAKVKAVLEDERIASACLGMNNVGLLTSNVAAVLDKTKLTQKDRDVFTAYARATCSGYCAGCAENCASALPDMPYVSDIMRYLMYYNSYGDKQGARGLFARIPAGVRDRLLSIDYRTAEAACPQHIPIGEAIAEAVEKLA